MSDLSATQCGGGCSYNEGNGSSCWIILILLLCCGGCGSNALGNGLGGGNDCSCLILILLLLSCCGNGGLGGNGFGC